MEQLCHAPATPGNPGPKLGAKADELVLWSYVKHGRMPSQVARLIGMHPRRLEVILDKWTRNRIFDYGVSVRTGWPT